MSTMCHPLQDGITKAQSWLFTALAGAVGLALLLMYRMLDRDPTADTQAMQAAAADLRRRRAAAKRALLAAAGDAGEVVLPGGRGCISWWASGPRDASTVVLLAAGDGETAAFWGLVHDRLARLSPTTPASGGATSGVRVISFHRSRTTDAIHGSGVSTSSNSNTSSRSTNTKDGRDELQAAQRATPLSLRVRDADAVLEAACGKAVPHAASSSWFKPRAAGAYAGGTKTRQLVVVAHGEGAWGALAFGGLHAAQLRGCVLVSPVLMHRGRHTAWWDAIPAASRVRHATDPGRLQKLLEPPPVPPEALLPAPSNAPSQSSKDIAALTTPSLDDSKLRTRSLQTAARSGLTASSKAALDRLAEDMRRERSRHAVLTTNEHELLMSVGPRIIASPAQSATRLPSSASASTAEVRVLTFAPDALPSFVAPELRAALMVWWLTAASRVGYYIIPEDARQGFDAAHKAIEAAMQAELTGGAHASGAAAKAVDATSADDNTGGPGTNAAHELGTKLSKLLINEADTFEKVYASHAIQRMPAAIGLTATLAPGESQSFRQMQQELAAFPPSFHVTLVHKQPREALEAAKQKAVSKMSSLFAAAAGGTGGTSPDWVSLPLQAADAVADAVVAVLRAPNQSVPALSVGEAAGSGNGTGKQSSAAAVAERGRAYEHWYPPPRDSRATEALA